MLHYVLRTKAGQWQEDSMKRTESEPLALVRINAKVEGTMTIGLPRPTRFGPSAPVTRNGQHVYNLMIGDNEDVEAALFGISGWMLQMVTQAEWETWAEMNLFPVLRTAVAR